MNTEELPLFELGNPGPLRDKLIASTLAGSKTASTSLLSEWIDDNEELPQPGERRLMINSVGKPIVLIEITDVEIKELRAIDYDTAQAEGENFNTIDEWRKAHEKFWLGEQYDSSRKTWQIDDSAKIVIERFRVVEVLEK